jgi:hypothetical protein
MRKYTDNELYFIAEAMGRFGGSFVQALSLALRNADMWNRDRLVKAFPELFEEYLIKSRQYRKQQ